MYLRAALKAIWKRLTVVSFWFCVLLLVEALLPYEIPGVSVLLHLDSGVIPAQQQQQHEKNMSATIAFVDTPVPVLTEDGTLDAQAQNLGPFNDTALGLDDLARAIPPEELARDIPPEELSVDDGVQEVNLVMMDKEQEQEPDVVGDTVGTVQHSRVEVMSVEQNV